MKQAVIDFLSQELQPFLADFLPLLKILWDSLILAVFTLIVLGIVIFIENRLEARIQMKQGKKIKSIAAEVIKYFFKAPLIPAKADKLLFILSPVFAFVACLFIFLLLPLTPDRSVPRLELGLLYLLFASSFSVYTFISGGWASGSRFGFLGAVRSFSQTISCQIILTLAVMIILMSAQTANLSEIVRAQSDIWFVLPHFPIFVLYLLCCSMMMSQAPFEGGKSSKELASGIYAEYSGALYLFFLYADYILLLLASVLGVLLFFGGWLPLFDVPFLTPAVWMGLKVLAFLGLFISIRITLPSYKVDQLMQMSFKIFLPFSVFWLLLTAGVVFFFKGGA